MPRVATIISIMLIALGLVAYFLLQSGDDRSFTALIPAMVGGALLIPSLIALKSPRLRKHMMHVLMVLALVGFAGAIMRPMKAAFSEQGFEFNTASGVQLGMAALCLLLLVLGVASFVKARKPTAA